MPLIVTGANFSHENHFRKMTFSFKHDHFKCSYTVRVPCSQPARSRVRAPPAPPSSGLSARFPFPTSFSNAPSTTPLPNQILDQNYPQTVVETVATAKRHLWAAVAVVANKRSKNEKHFRKMIFAFKSDCLLFGCAPGLASSQPARSRVRARLAPPLSDLNVRFPFRRSFSNARPATALTTS